MSADLTNPEMLTTEPSVSWADIKGRFVDDPAGAIAAAEEQVQRSLDQHINTLRSEAERLCAQDRSEDAESTESLRLRLLRYEEYCDRLTPTVH